MMDGPIGPNARLDALTREIIIASPADLAGICDRVADALREEPDLALVMIRAHVARVMGAMRQERERFGPGRQPAGRDDGGGGQHKHEVQRRLASVAVISIPARGGEEAGQQGDDTQLGFARPSPNPAVAAMRLAAMGKAAAVRGEVYREFEAITIDGRSMLDATTERALAWGERKGREVVLVRALCSLIPDPRRPIREQLTDEIVDQARRIVDGRNSAL